MQEFIYDSWNGVMNADKNPLRHIPDNMTRHMILQILAWTWCTSFSLWIGSITFFGFSAVAHMFILAAIVVTVTTMAARINICAIAENPKNVILPIHNENDVHHVHARI